MFSLNSEQYYAIALSLTFLAQSGAYIYSVGKLSKTVDQLKESLKALTGKMDRTAEEVKGIKTDSYLLDPKEARQYLHYHDSTCRSVKR